MSLVDRGPRLGVRAIRSTFSPYGRTSGWGAGGGRMWIEEDPDKRVNLLRTDQALESDPEVIAVSCPFCMTMLSDGIKAKDLEDKVQTLDVMEIVDRVTR